ncbi:hypothetical protein M885DRAFT_289659 [Pelagophyceae sp. CCMP2097]|nr:hypothetical protein M885DRAFT_289659 [Pelagophyceae sp. CCMP2097]|mmetsp:Transcript_9488/g.32763  ORF Transcript_9488/g.32763 Transcript_9488/m.32763 type:complete len:344 (+) Transcript_9488:149-1180(+)
MPFSTMPGRRCPETSVESRDRRRRGLSSNPSRQLKTTFENTTLNATHPAGRTPKSRGKQNPGQRGAPGPSLSGAPKNSGRRRVQGHCSEERLGKSRKGVCPASNASPKSLQRARGPLARALGAGILRRLVSGPRQRDLAAGTPSRESCRERTTLPLKRLTLKRLTFNLFRGMPLGTLPLGALSRTWCHLGPLGRDAFLRPWDAAPRFEARPLFVFSAGSFFRGGVACKTSYHPLARPEVAGDRRPNGSSEFPFQRRGFSEWPARYLSNRFDWPLPLRKAGKKSPSSLWRRRGCPNQKALWAAGRCHLEWHSRPVETPARNASIAHKTRRLQTQRIQRPLKEAS